MTVSRYRVEGMDCAAEEQLVRIGLAGVDGIARIAVDLTVRHVLVEHHNTRLALDAAMAAVGLGAQHLDDDVAPMPPPENTTSERRALTWALVINAAFFVAEVGVGLLRGSLGLLGDGLDMGADAFVYALALAAVGTTAARKRRLARTGGFLQLVPAVIGLAEVARRFVVGVELPDPVAMIGLSILALGGNATVLLLLSKVRSEDAHMQASWIFTANDIKVNGLVILAGVGVWLTSSAVPDLVAGGLIFLVVADGARRIVAASATPR